MPADRDSTLLALPKLPALVSGVPVAEEPGDAVGQVGDPGLLPPPPRRDSMRSFDDPISDAPVIVDATGGDGKLWSPAQAFFAYLACIALFGAAAYVVAAAGGRYEQFGEYSGSLQYMLFDVGTIVIHPLGGVLMVLGTVVISFLTLARAVAPRERACAAVSAAIGPVVAFVVVPILALQEVKPWDMASHWTYVEGWFFNVMPGGGLADPLLVPEVVFLGLVIGAAIGAVAGVGPRDALRTTVLGACSGLATGLTLGSVYLLAGQFGRLGIGWALGDAVALFVIPSLTSGAISLATYPAPRRPRPSAPMRYVAPPTGPTHVQADPTGASPVSVVSPQQVVFAPQGPTNGLAVASLVCSLLGLCWVGSLLGVIFGGIALSQIKRSNGWERGRGMAIAGLVIGIVSLVFLMLYVVLFLVLGVAGSSQSY